MDGVLQMSVISKAGMFVVATLACVYIYSALRGPQGLPALQQRWQEIRTLQQQNADLASEVQRKADRIRRLKENPSEQELEIRKRLKLLRPGETTFIIPDEQGSSERNSEPRP